MPLLCFPQVTLEQSAIRLGIAVRADYHTFDSIMLLRPFEHLVSLVAPVPPVAAAFRDKNFFRASRQHPAHKAAARVEKHVFKFVKSRILRVRYTF